MRMITIARTVNVVVKSTAMSMIMTLLPSVAVMTVTHMLMMADEM